MCEFCEKVEMTKYGLMINLDIAKGIYDNHKTCRYCVCKQDGFIVYIAKDIEEAEDVLEKYKKYFEVKIVDLEIYASTTEWRVKRMSETIKKMIRSEFDKGIEIPNISLENINKTLKKMDEITNEMLNPFDSVLDKMVKDIRDRQDNVMAMEFTKCIGELLRKNGVTPKITEYTRNFETDKTFETRYGVSIDELDFSEHDKVFEDKIASLEKELSSVVKEAERQEFIREMSCFERQELKQRIAELESKEDEKPTKYTTVIVAKEINGQEYVRLEDFMSVVNDLQAQIGT